MKKLNNIFWLIQKILFMSRKATMKDNFSKRSTKKDKKINTQKKYGKFTQRHVRKVEKYKKVDTSEQK